MTIIKKLSEMIEEELEDAEKYIKCALHHFQQSQYLLSNLGRFVAWAGSGAPAATASGN